MNFQNFHRNELSLTRSSPQDSKVGVCNTASKVSVFGDIQSECRKMRTRITPNTDTFHAVIALPTISEISKLAVMLIIDSTKLISFKNDEILQ